MLPKLDAKCYLGRKLHVASPICHTIEIGRQCGRSIKRRPSHVAKLVVRQQTPSKLWHGCCYSTPEKLEIVTGSATDNLWHRLRTNRGLLDIALSLENYELAAKLRDEKKELVAQLPPVDQFLYHQVQLVLTGSLEVKEVAIKAIGETGSFNCIDVLADSLKNPDLLQVAHEAMLQVFLRHVSPEVNELMQQGMQLMGAGGDMTLAQQVFEEVIQLDPKFAEAHNKRATCLYLRLQYEASIDACKVTLELNPWHWAAASGMGLCLMSLKRYEEAIEAFTRAKNIHPGMARWVDNSIARLRGKLQQEGRVEAGESAAGGGSEQ